jgi:hypothetical protein
VESCINSEIKYVSTWLCANKLSLNIEKSSFVIFHPIQKKIGDSFRVILNNESLKREYKTKYLGVVIDCHLNWRDHVSHVSKKIKCNIGAISKVCHFVNLEILKSLYYALVYPYLTWGNTCHTTLNPLFILQKKIVRLITFSDYNDHTNSLFLKLKIIKMYDLVHLVTAMFMYDFHYGILPTSFDTFFLDIKHSHDTRLASGSSYSIPKIRTNYGKYKVYWSKDLEFAQ